MDTTAEASSMADVVGSKERDLIMTRLILAERGGVDDESINLARITRDHSSALFEMQFFIKNATYKGVPTFAMILGVGGEERRRDATQRLRWGDSCDRRGPKKYLTASEKKQRVRR